MFKLYSINDETISKIIIFRDLTEEQRNERKEKREIKDRQKPTGNKSNLMYKNTNLSQHVEDPFANDTVQNISECTKNSDMEITVLGGISQTIQDPKMTGARPKEDTQRDQ